MPRRRQRTHDIYLPNKKEQAEEDRRKAAAKTAAERPPPSKPAEKPAPKKKRGIMDRLRDPFGMSSTLKRAGDTAKRGAPARRRGR